MSSTWQDRAACVGHPTGWWFPDGRTVEAAADRAKAKTVCAGCPVLVDCLLSALEGRERYGIHGGAGATTRRALARALPGCGHDPAKACQDPGCGWCTGIQAHRDRLTDQAARSDRARRVQAYGPKATHGRASTYARGCRCGACRFRASTAGRRLAAAGVDVPEWWATWIDPTDQALWSDGGLLRAKRVAWRRLQATEGLAS